MYCVLPPLFVLNDVLFSLFARWGHNCMVQTGYINRCNSTLWSNELKIAVADIANHAYGAYVNELV